MYSDWGLTPSNNLIADLDLHYGGKFIVQWLDFVNAPSTALWLSGYGSSVSLSNFGRGSGNFSIHLQV